MVLTIEPFAKRRDVASICAALIAPQVGVDGGNVNQSQITRSTQYIAVRCGRLDR
jgi:Fe-S cluster biogenesis protein NfuA